MLFDGNGKPRLCDFGQSRLSTDHKPSLGTFLYGARAGRLAGGSRRSLGCVRARAMLYAMLVGAPPYRDGPLQPLLRRATTLPERLRVYREFCCAASRPIFSITDEVSTQRWSRSFALSGHRPGAALSQRPGGADGAGSAGNPAAATATLAVGALGPALLLVVTSLIALKGVRVAVQTTSVAVTQRARESSQFAARFVAETAGREIDRRWSVLEQAALDPALRQELTLLPPGHTAPSPTLQRFIEAQSRQNADLAAASWFVTAVSGFQLARAPYSDTIGRNWAFRTTFTGSAESCHAIRRRRRSGPSRSRIDRQCFPSATRTRLVAFSVPI